MLLARMFFDAFALAILIAQKLLVFEAQIVHEATRAKPRSKDLLLGRCRFQFEAICFIFFIHKNTMQRYLRKNKIYSVETQVVELY